MLLAGWLLDSRKNLEWINDGVKDCENGIDEDLSYWAGCGGRKYYRLNTDFMTLGIPGAKCKNGFKCSNNRVLSKQVCNDVYNCDEERNVCMRSRRMSTLKWFHIPYHQGSYHIQHCLPGLTLDKTDGKAICVTQVFPVKSLILGVKKDNFRVPKGKISCKHLFGELYVFYTCLGICRDATCILSTPTLEFNSCQHQYRHEDKIYTLVDNDKLTFVDVNKYGQLELFKFFSCTNEKCVTYDGVCNFVDDCEDGLDESGALTNSSVRLVKWSRGAEFVMATFDCVDLLDERHAMYPSKVTEPNLHKLILGLLLTIVSSIELTRALLKLSRKSRQELVMQEVAIVLRRYTSIIFGAHIVLSFVLALMYPIRICSMVIVWKKGVCCKFVGMYLSFALRLPLYSSLMLSILYFRKGTHI